MNTTKQIKDFNEANRPFYIVDHENGQYSLCLAFSFLHGDLSDYGQEAFNAYARELGDTTMPINEFLMQDAYRIQPDIFNPNTYQLITDEALELQEQQSNSGDPVMQGMQSM